MISLGKGGGSSLGSGLDPLMNSPIMQTLRGNNQAPEMAGNAANLDLLQLFRANGDYWAKQGNADHWRAQGQFNGEPQPSAKPRAMPDLNFNLPQAPSIAPRAPSGNRQSKPLVDVDEIIRRRLYGGR